MELGSCISVSTCQHNVSLGYIISNFVGLKEEGQVGSSKCSKTYVRTWVSFFRIRWTSVYQGEKVKSSGSRPLDFQWTLREHVQLDLIFKEGDKLSSGLSYGLQICPSFFKPYYCYLEFRLCNQVSRLAYFAKSFFNCK